MTTQKTRRKFGGRFYHVYGKYTDIFKARDIESDLRRHGYRTKTTARRDGIGDLWTTIWYSDE